jgi:hypothetical protein
MIVDCRTAPFKGPNGPFLSGTSNGSPVWGVRFQTMASAPVFLLICVALLMRS